jgi:hypothetical protein
MAAFSQVTETSPTYLSRRWLTLASQGHTDRHVRSSQPKASGGDSDPTKNPRANQKHP